MMKTDPQQKTRDLIAQKYKDGKIEEIITSTVDMMKYLADRRISWTAMLVYFDQIGVEYSDVLEARLRVYGL